MLGLTSLCCGIIDENTSEAAPKLAAHAVLGQMDNKIPRGVYLAGCPVLVHDSRQAFRELRGVAVMRFSDDAAGTIDEPLPYAVFADFGHAVVKIAVGKIEIVLYEQLGVVFVVHESDLAGGFHSGDAFAEISRINILVYEGNDDFAMSIDISKLELVVGDGGETLGKRARVEELWRNNDFSGFVYVAELSVSGANRGQALGKIRIPVPAPPRGHRCTLLLSNRPVQ